MNHLAQREVFHICFLKALTARLKPASYCLKGGTNLRFFFGSIRYSEDMDIDVGEVELFKLKDIVMDIITSKTLLTNLRPFMIERIIPPDMKVAKQTQTTQRFKIHLITTSGQDLFTKIEFSRRRSDGPCISESILGSVLGPYKMVPFVVSHYPVEVAILQKIKALSDRSQTQARDIFDLYMILPQSANVGRTIKDIPIATLKKARGNIFNIDYEIFRDTVIEYLSEDDQTLYNRKDVWEDIQLKVEKVLNDCNRGNS